VLRPLRVHAARPLTQAFFARETLAVAVDLLGALLVRGSVVLRISEVEAYRHPFDSANHCRSGRTARNAPMWGPPGHAYLYLCYGMHALLNLVTDQDGHGAAVLIRGAEPVAGHALIAERRGGKLTPASLAGPGKVAAALGLGVGNSGMPLAPEAGLYAAEGPGPGRFRVGPRVGVDYAAARDRTAPYRLALLDSRWVSQPKGLSVWGGTAAEFLRAHPPHTCAAELAGVSPRRTRL
jgi:DNA-3-methyladenine glycosylase